MKMMYFKKDYDWFGSYSIFKTDDPEIISELKCCKRTARITRKRAEMLAHHRADKIEVIYRNADDVLTLGSWGRCPKFEL